MGDRGYLGRGGRPLFRFVREEDMVEGDEDGVEGSINGEICVDLIGFRMDCRFNEIRGRKKHSDQPSWKTPSPPCPFHSHFLSDSPLSTASSSLKSPKVLVNSIGIVSSASTTSKAARMS